MSPESSQSVESNSVTLSDVVTELRAIRSLLEKQGDETAKCPHGATGICMDCISPLVNYHLESLVNQISNEAWAAMRRG